MSSVLTPSNKRSHSQSPKQSNGRKFQKLKQDFKTPTGYAELRVLCLNSRVEYLTGNNGFIISQICQETGTSIIVHEPVSGCDERVISISKSEVNNENAKEEKKPDDEQSNAAEVPNDDQNNEEKDGNDDGSPQGEILDIKDSLLGVQNGLLCLFEKMVGEEHNVENENDNEKEPLNSSLRFLVLSSQVDCILGKDGSMVKQVADESGAQVEVLPRDKLPACASSSDEVVLVSGTLGTVKKAIKLVSEKILENAYKYDDPSGPTVHSSGHSTPRFDAHASNRSSSQGSSFRIGSRDGHDRRNTSFKLREPFFSNRSNNPSQIMSFRLLCPADRIGSLIGKAGSVIKGLRLETGCEINIVENNLDNEEDRIIVMSGPAHPDDRISPAQDAVLRVQAHISNSKAAFDKKEVVAKLLVPSNQIGCLLGIGGAIIAEMKKSTGAFIRIQHGKDQTPRPASDNPDVVVINGDFQTVQDALLHVTSRLRNFFFRDVYSSLNLPMNPPSLDSSFMGRREQLSPKGGFPKIGLPPLRHFDTVGGPPLRPGFLPHDDRPPFMHDIRGPGAPSHISERPWDPQVMREGGPMDFVGGPPRRMGGYPGGGRFITNTEFQVVVPTSVVPSIYGESGGCLRQIRQISDAKITITDPKPGASETIISISGTPEQTHAAQSLIQAFVMCETESF